MRVDCEQSQQSLFLSDSEHKMRESGNRERSASKQEWAEQKWGTNEWKKRDCQLSCFWRMPDNSTHQAVSNLFLSSFVPHFLSAHSRSLALCARFPLSRVCYRKERGTVHSLVCVSFPGFPRTRISKHIFSSYSIMIIIFFVKDYNTFSN